MTAEEILKDEQSFFLEQPSFHRIAVQHAFALVNVKGATAAAAATVAQGEDDTVDPGMITGLTVATSSAGMGAGVQVSFTSPGEDGDEGQVAGYDIRAATSRDMLSDADMFGALAGPASPAAVAPGEMVQADFTFMDLGVAGDAGFFVGVRAVDAAGNAGAIAITEFTP